MIENFKWALVTGGSSGIGREFVLELCKRGLNVIAVGRDTKRLEELVQQVKDVSGSTVLTYAVDLSSSERVKTFIQDVSKYEVDLLVNNAGFGLYGEFIQLEQEEIEKMIEVNVKALTLLSHIFAKKMVERRRGGIINVASVAGHIPLPYFNAYAATKAYVYNFSIALWAELRKYNVHVMCVSPGPTETRFFERAFKGQNIRAFGNLMKPEQVVAGAIEAFEKKKAIYIPGFKNKLVSFVGKKLLSDKTIAKFMVG